jgi:predicted Fe-S protein YdhL (DUF1289 family)
MEKCDIAVQFPCTRNCCLNDDDTCLGCFRSLDEITAWNEADEDARRMIMHEAIQRREAYFMGKEN